MSALLRSKPEPTPLLSIGRVGRHCKVFVKDESVHATGTFKDRLSAAALARQPRDTVFGSISYGNTAISFARAMRSQNDLAFVGFFPFGFRDWVFGPSSTGFTATGRDIEEAVLADNGKVVELDLTSAIFRDSELARLAAQACTLKEREFINVTEGLDEPAYAPIASEALEQMGDSPDVCVVQYGAGILANEVRDVMARFSPKTTVVAISTPFPSSLAKMLYGPVWLDVNELASSRVAMSRHQTPDRTGVSREPYPVHWVTEEHIQRGLAAASDAMLSAEPSGAAGLGFLDELEAIVTGYDPSRHSVLVINTGNGIDRLANRRAHT